MSFWILTGAARHGRVASENRRASSWWCHPQRSTSVCKFSTHLGPAGRGRSWASQDSMGRHRSSTGCEIPLTVWRPGRRTISGRPSRLWPSSSHSSRAARLASSQLRQTESRNVSQVTVDLLEDNVFFGARRRPGGPTQPARRRPAAWLTRQWGQPIPHGGGPSRNGLIVTDTVSEVPSEVSVTVSVVVWAFARAGGSRVIDEVVAPVLQE
jgi:hypothetical protein